VTPTGTLTGPTIPLVPTAAQVFENANGDATAILTTDSQLPFPEPTSLEVLYAGDAPAQPADVIQVNFLLPPWFAGLFQVQIGTASASFHLWVR